MAKPDEQALSVIRRIGDGPCHYLLDHRNRERIDVGGRASVLRYGMRPLFLPRAACLNKAHVPGFGLLLQGIWSVALVLPRTYDPASGNYGNVYSNLLDYVISAALIFYILTIAGVIRLRFKRPLAERPYRTAGYPWLPLFYIAGGLLIVVCLFTYRAATTWPGLAIVASGVPVYFIVRRTSPQAS